MNRQALHKDAAGGRTAPAETLLETMNGLTERPDLERLFDRKVPMSQILRLAGKGVAPGQVRLLLDGPDPAHALRKILGR